MFYISAASGITHQPTFKNEGFSGTVAPLNEVSDLISPNYKEYIDAGLLRRMSKILRMSVACARECLFQVGIDQPDAIVVGTGLGCLQDTEKFLNTFLTIEGLLPPTSFIQSTHNTIAGQISLSIGNHGYNMTHTQNTLSFEHAMIDAMMLLKEGDKAVLIGAADEYIDFLSEVGVKFGLGNTAYLTSGASFFIANSHTGSGTLAFVKDVRAIGLFKDAKLEIESFLNQNELRPSQIDQVFFRT